jgi:3-dehydroquinate dehydratase-2
MNVLVLHGPNLNLLGERPGDAPGQTLSVLDAELRRRAAALGATVRAVQSNHEGALVDALHQERGWLDGVLVSPAALAQSGHVLRDALLAVGKPAVEVHLARRTSVLKEASVAQVTGKGFDAYFKGLEQLCTRKAKAARPGPAGKTLGRPVAKTAAGVAAGAAVSGFLTRALVRQKIGERLAGKLSPSGLSTWARSRWLDVQRGAAAETGQRELLEDSLQQLVLSSMPPAKMRDEELLALMAQLDG